MNQDLTTLISQIKEITSGILEKDVTTMRGFAANQVEAIARQTLLLQQGILSREIPEDLIEFFFDGLEKITLNFVNTLKGLLLITIEKVWNAINDFLWGIINSVTDISS